MELKEKVYKLLVETGRPYGMAEIIQHFDGGPMCSDIVKVTNELREENRIKFDVWNWTYYVERKDT